MLTSVVAQVGLSMLDGNEDLLRVVKDFVTGWIMFCTAHRRYYLTEPFEDEQYLPPYDEDSEMSTVCQSALLFIRSSWTDCYTG